MLHSRTMRRVGWFLFGLMWFPFITFFVDRIVVSTGSQDLFDLSVISRYSISLLAILCGASTLLLMGAPVASGLRNRSAQNEGLPARAEIMKIWDTGTSINDNPVVGMLLEVHLPEGPVFEAETEQLIARLHVPMIQPGNAVQVKYDPQTQAVVLIID